MKCESLNCRRKVKFTLVCPNEIINAKANYCIICSNKSKEGLLKFWIKQMTGDLE